MFDFCSICWKSDCLTSLGASKYSEYVISFPGKTQAAMPCYDMLFVLLFVRWINMHI